MQDTIIIIESPNKCEKIESYTGAKVYATKGHFMELSEEFINYETYEPSFILKESSKKYINFIFQQCKGKEVIIATDPDREGYAIGYMFFEKIKNIATSIKRAEFHEITKEGIQKGLKEARDFGATNKKLFESFKSRIVGDKMVGFIMSPKLMQKFGVFKNISVGRVQTPALALIVKKALDLESYNNTPKEQRLSYKVIAKTNIENVSYTLSNENVFANKQEAQEFLDSIANKTNAFIANIQEKESKKSPPKPYQAVSLIKDSNTLYNFSSKDTMDIAQKLFEKGFITYHRTDSEMIAQGFLDEIEKKYAKEEWYEKRSYNVGKHSQAQAHEAIRITHIDSNTQELNENELKLYNLIRDNTIYSQSKDSIFTTIKYEINILGRIFSLSLRIPQYISIFEKNNKEQDDTDNADNESFSLATKPQLKENDNIVINGFEIKEIEKKPPAPYKESDFIPLLQKEGIGRPSTYASFIPTLLKREFVAIEKKGKKDIIVATPKGIQAIKHLESMNDNWITTSEFTKNMEEVLDLITENKASYLDFIKPLHERMGNVIPKEREIKPPTQTQIALAEKIAQENNITLPKEVLESMKECSNFIDKHKKEYPPSQKQLDFAKKLAKDKGIALPKNVETSSKECSNFITKHKGGK